MSERLVGYARVSDNALDLTAQREALARLGVATERVHCDHGLVGTNRPRPGLREAIDACRAGDTLVVTRIDQQPVPCPTPAKSRRGARRQRESSSAADPNGGAPADRTCRAAFAHHPSS